MLNILKLDFWNGLLLQSRVIPSNIKIRKSKPVYTHNQIFGEDGTLSGRAGIQAGDGILHGEQDPPAGDMATGTGTTGTDPHSPPQEQESLFLNLLKYLFKSFVFSFRKVYPG